MASLADKSALLASGPDAEALLGAERAKLGEGILAALSAFPNDADVELRVGEWGARAALGLVAVQRLPDGGELVAAVPKKLDAAWSALAQGLTAASTGDVALTGTDPFQGPLIARRTATMILIVAGHAEASAATAALDAAVARVNGASP